MEVVKGQELLLKQLLHLLLTTLSGLCPVHQRGTLQFLEDHLLLKIPTHYHDQCHQDRQYLLVAVLPARQDLQVRHQRDPLDTKPLNANYLESICSSTLNS